MNVLSMRDASRAYGLRWALDGAHLDLGAGEAVALLGPNGAGKTTLLYLAAGLIRPTRGEVLVFGAPAHRAARHRVGLCAHRSFLYSDLTAIENLVFYARLAAILDPVERSVALLARLGLEDRRHDRVRTLSRGLEQRVALARALLTDPDLLLLDEPFAGLDRESADRLDRDLASLRQGGKAILVATHDLDRAASLCDRAVQLSRGRVVPDGLSARGAEALAARGAPPP